MPSAISSKIRVEYKCSICKDAGWVWVADRRGNVIWENGAVKKQRCACAEGDNRERNRRRLEALDGLTSTERMQRFTHLDRMPYEPHWDDLMTAVSRCCGMATLVGSPGVGKTAFLIAAVNDCRERNVLAVYSTMAGILDYLRQAYAPDSRITADQRWDTLLRCQLLAIDELGDFSPTEWALEHFYRLVDERWRNTHARLTLFAMNGEIDALPEKIVSRLSDVQRSLVVKVQGRDYRREP